MNIKLINDVISILQETVDVTSTHNFEVIHKEKLPEELEKIVIAGRTCLDKVAALLEQAQDITEAEVIARFINRTLDEDENNDDEILLILKEAHASLIKFYLRKATGRELCEAENSTAEEVTHYYYMASYCKTVIGTLRDRQ